MIIIIIIIIIINVTELSFLIKKGWNFVFSI